MALDFSGIDSIAHSGANTPDSEHTAAGGIITPTAKEKPDSGAISADTAAIYKAYQKTIAATEMLQSDILKGAKAGEDIYTLFLKAALAISEATGNDAFYKQLKGDVQSVYGIGLQEEQPLQVLIAETQTRLDKLKTAAAQETDADSSRRITAAIRAHTERIQWLQGRLK